MPAPAAAFDAALDEALLALEAALLALDAALAALFDNARVRYGHVRSATNNCYTCRIEAA